MTEKISYFNSLSKKNRIATVVSILWVMAVTIVVIDSATYEAYGSRPDELSESFFKFLLYGILPVFLYWGLRWIKSSKD
jgi:hypothetical protein